jgi:hypothetical protein
MHSVAVAGIDTWLLSDKLRTQYMPGHISRTLTFPLTCSVHRTFLSSNRLSFSVTRHLPNSCPYDVRQFPVVQGLSAGHKVRDGECIMDGCSTVYEGHSTNTFGALFTCVAHGHVQVYNVMCGDRSPVWLTGWPYIQNVAIVEEILSCQPVKNRNTGAVWDCMDSHRASLWLLKCVQLHGSP